MQIVKYEIQSNILTVGFKEGEFVVYTDIAYDSTLTKQELLQKAYEQVKGTIEYEKSLPEHSITTDEIGEEFIPEISKPIKLEIDFSSLKGKVLDQYGDIYSVDIVFSIEGTDKAVIQNGQVIEQKVTTDTEYYIVAKYNNLFVEKQKKIIYAPKIVQSQVSENDEQIANFILDTITRLDSIEKKINGGARYVGI